MYITGVMHYKNVTHVSVKYRSYIFFFNSICTKDINVHAYNIIYIISHINTIVLTYKPILLF